MSLETRFKEFLLSIKGIENIDELPLTDLQKSKQIADYFAENRQLIIELKSLKTDTNPKVEKILESHRSRPEFPVFFGEWEVEKVLKHLPDGKEINKSIVEATTTSLKEIYQKANRQIRDTKSTFNLPESQGLLIVLNEKIDILTPEVIMYRLSRMSKVKFTDQKTLRYTEINCILLISEAHFAPRSDGLMAFPIIRQPINGVSAFQFDEFLNDLSEKWSSFNKAPLFKTGEIKSIKDLDVRSVSQHKEATRREIPRQEAWVRYYKRNPYFRSYDEKKLKWLFKMMMSELAFGLLKGATKQQLGRNNFWVEVFTHFMEEIRFRGIDMRFFTLDKNISSEIDAEVKKRFPEDYPEQ